MTYMGFRATLNFRKVMVALNPITALFKTLPKVASYHAYQKLIILKKFHRAPKAVIKGVFKRSYCCYGNL